jgi:hypothetical protein
VKIQLTPDQSPHRKELLMRRLVRRQILLRQLDPPRFPLT